MNTGGFTPADLQNMGFFFDAVNAFKPAPTLTQSPPTGVQRSSNPSIREARSLPAELNLNDPNLNDSPSAVKVSKPRSKVARLPEPVRQHLNALLQNGASYSQVIAWLNAHGHTGFNKVNLHNWRIGAFQNWLRKRTAAKEKVSDA